jgi:hypothetical protein
VLTVRDGRFIGDEWLDTHWEVTWMLEQIKRSKWFRRAYILGSLVVVFVVTAAPGGGKRIPR